MGTKVVADAAGLAAVEPDAQDPAPEQRDVVPKDTEAVAEAADSAAVEPDAIRPEPGQQEVVPKETEVVAEGARAASAQSCTETEEVVDAFNRTNVEVFIEINDTVVEPAVDQKPKLGFFQQFQCC